MTGLRSLQTYLTRPRLVTAVDLVVVVTGSGMVGTLTCYEASGNRRVLELYPCDSTEQVVELAQAAAASEWRLNLGEPVRRYELLGRELYVHYPTPL